MTELHGLVEEILCSGDLFLAGIHGETKSLPTLLVAVTDWGRVLGRSLEEIVSVVEPSLRQSIFMSLLPAKALKRNFAGSYDEAIDEHMRRLGLAATAEQRA